MISLNHTRNRQTIDDVMTELDAFEKEIAAVAKPFTAFILDTDRQPEDPFVVHFNTTSGAMMHGDIEAAYFYHCEDTDTDFETTGGANSIGDWWQHKGAAVIGVVYGHHAVSWSPDGMANADYDSAFDLARQAEEKAAAAADPFKETYRTAWISTAHLSPATLNGLNEIAANRALPFWVHATEYGYIMRFDYLHAFGLGECQCAAQTWITEQADLMEIKAALFKHGYHAAHLDADGPLIEGITEYDH